jgi:hypothetical protein
MKEFPVNNNTERIKKHFGKLNKQISIKKFHKKLKNKDNFMCFLGKCNLCNNFLIFKATKMFKIKIPPRDFKAHKKVS